jgi:hypothetical protein
VITCQRHPARKKIQTISDIPVLFPPKFDKHTFDKQRLRKNTKQIFCSFHFYKQQPKKTIHML